MISFITSTFDFMSIEDPIWSGFYYKTVNIMANTSSLFILTRMSRKMINQYSETADPLFFQVGNIQYDFVLFSQTNTFISFLRHYS